jgi:tRNA-dihydrouridine synthase
MDDRRQMFTSMLTGSRPVLALAPMQDVTDLLFWGLLSGYGGGADVYFTEYFRVYPSSCLDRRILQSVTGNPTGKPVVAQMIGNDIPALVRTARELQQHPVAAVDLNLGCPAPVVYRKCAGGGLLRDLLHVDSVLGALREAISISFSVKTRLGFETPEVFQELLPILRKHSVDLITVHGRTVRQMYRGDVRYDLIAQAARELACPVLANGNINSAAQALSVVRETGAKGVMLGRGAIRNPWLFQQIRQLEAGENVHSPRGWEVLDYVRKLYEAVCSPHVREHSQVQKMKKYLNHLGAGVEPSGAFLHRMRRVETKAHLFLVCEEFLGHDRPLPLEPFEFQQPQSALAL